MDPKIVNDFGGAADDIIETVVNQREIGAAANNGCKLRRKFNRLLTWHRLPSSEQGAKVF